MSSLTHKVSRSRSNVGLELYHHSLISLIVVVTVFTRVCLFSLTSDLTMFHHSTSSLIPTWFICATSECGVFPSQSYPPNPKPQGCRRRPSFCLLSVCVCAWLVLSWPLGRARVKEGQPKTRLFCAMIEHLIWDLRKYIGDCTSG